MWRTAMAAIGCWLATAAPTHGQTLPNGQNCAVVQQRVTDSVQLALLCSRAIHVDQNTKQADASCRASAALFVDVGSDLEVAVQQPRAERDACLPPRMMSELRTATRFVATYLAYRLDGSGALPAPLAL